MPEEVVAAHLEAGLVRELEQRVGAVELELARRGFERRHLEFTLGDQDAALFADQLVVARIREAARGERGAEHETFLVREAAQRSQDDRVRERAWREQIGRASCRE